MNKKWNIFLIVLSIILMVAIGVVVYTEPDENLEIAKEIYAEKLGIDRSRPKRSYDFIPKNIRDLPKRLRNAQKYGAHEFDSEMHNAYFILSKANKSLCDDVILEVMDILIENNRPVMLCQFFKVANTTEDSTLRAFSCVKYPKMMSYFTMKRVREMRKIKDFRGVNLAFERINYDFSRKGSDPERIDKMFKHATIYGKGKIHGNPQTSYPLVAFIAKYKGYNEIYEFYKQKSISDEQFENLSKSIFDYAQFAIKIFALADEPDVALNLLDKLPESPNKNLLIKRVIRYILASKGGVDAVKNSELGKLLEN